MPTKQCWSEHWTQIIIKHIYTELRAYVGYFEHSVHGNFQKMHMINKIDCNSPKVQSVAQKRKSCLNVFQQSVDDMGTMCICVCVRKMQVRPQLGSNRKIKPTQKDTDLKFTLSFSKCVSNMLQKKQKNKIYEHISTKHTLTHTIKIQRNVLCCYFYMINLPDPTLHGNFQVIKIDF